ncbi:actin family protein [Kipferlia bialata]|uniref:Actin family protein n=1 Tax=Kipferlia bialata TaxID=797122 RepID=A0A9K3D0R6_9EUKA|nr:actin family protein [Kipferlia bialata]|eukprot:g7734.t1
MRPSVVFDCGSSYSKFGFANGNRNPVPLYSVPTALCKHHTLATKGMDDMGYAIGTEAVTLSKRTEAPIINPIREGRIEDWDAMERFWAAAAYQYLRCDPSQHPFVITEPALNTPEAREQMAEILFETLNVPVLMIVNQPAMALYSAAHTTTTDAGSQSRPLTGCVVDLGHSAVNIIPVSDGHVLDASVRQYPLGGRDVEQFIHRQLRYRENIPSECQIQTARQVKHECCKVAKKGLRSVLTHFTAEPAKYTKALSGKHPRTGAPFNYSVGLEQWAAPEIFFTPSLVSPSLEQGLCEVLDGVIQSSPIHVRRSLYDNIVVCGGSSAFHNMAERLETGVKAIVDERLKGMGGSGVGVNVVKPKRREDAVWSGAAYLSQTLELVSGKGITREMYEDQGPSCARVPM